MKKISLNLLTNVLLLLVGIVLIIFYTQADVLRWVAVTIGILFVLPSAGYLGAIAFRPAEQRRPIDMLAILPSVGGLCFGILMIVKPYLFEGVISLFMGVLMLVMGLFHIIYLLLSWRSLDVKTWYVFAPLAVTLAGVLVLASQGVRGNVALVTLLTGAAMLLFNFTSFQEYMAERKLRKEIAASRPAEGPKAELPVTTESSPAVVEQEPVPEPESVIEAEPAPVTESVDDTDYSVDE